VPVHKLSHLEHRDDLLAVEYRQQGFVCADVALGILELVFADVLPKLFGHFGSGEGVFADHCGQCGVQLTSPIMKPWPKILNRQVTDRVNGHRA
jgi:hypothetical protein